MCIQNLGHKCETFVKRPSYFVSIEAYTLLDHLVFISLKTMPTLKLNIEH